MRFLPTVGLYWKDKGAGSLNSGIKYSTQPTDLPLNALAVEGKRVFEFVRISGTCTVGSLLHLTGTNIGYVTVSGTGRMPYGVSLVAPTASGDWSWILKYGICTSLQVTGTYEVGASGISALIYAGQGSAAYDANGGCRELLSLVISSTASGLVPIGPIGQALTTATGSQVVGFINLL